MVPVEPEISFTCLHIHCGSVYCATFNQAGDLLVTGSNDQIVHLIRYNSERHAPEGSEYKLAIHNGTIRDVCFLGQAAPTSDEWTQSPSQQTTTNLLASAGAGEFEVNVSDCNVMKCINSFRGHESAVMSLHSSHESSNTFVSGSLDGTIRLWDLRINSSVSIITTKHAQQRSKAGKSNTEHSPTGQIDPNESLILDPNPGAVNEQQQARSKHDQENREPTSPEQQHLPQSNSDSTILKGTPVGCVRLDPSGRLLVSGHQDGSCMLYDIRAGKAIQLFQAHQDEIRTLNFSPKSYYLLTGSYDHKLKLLDLQGHLTSKLASVEVAELGDKCVQTAWHPYDYNFVSTCADGSATLWTIPNFEHWIDSVTMD